MVQKKELDLKVVYKDDRFIVFDKPAHLLTTSPDGDVSLASLAAEEFSGTELMHPTSRLDAQVTGLVLFARDKRANRAVLSARESHSYGRTYLGISLEPPGETNGRWDWTISLDPDNPRLRRTGDGKGARSAETKYRVCEQTPMGSLLAFKLVTGRTHQLRVHAAKAGCALFGDVQYGGVRRAVQADGAVITAARVMLHCASLEIEFEGEKNLSVKSSPPDDFDRVWRGLGGADPNAALL